jgi:hypothetical protein
MSEVTGTERCETCGASNLDGDLFGYQHPEGWRWFCATCRPGWHYADERLPALGNTSAKPEGDRDE